MPYRFPFDRYHAVMGNAYLSPGVTTPRGQLLGEQVATFYLTWRKLPFAPCLGHETLARLLLSSQIDAPHLRRLREDRARLDLLADALQARGGFLGTVRAVPEGTIMFAGQPFADCRGPLWNVQLHEVCFEHAFDLPMTIAHRAMLLRRAAGSSNLSDFSLRRNSDLERADLVAWAAYVGGFNDTSCLEAAFCRDIPDVGTMAHYFVESFAAYQEYPELDPQTGKAKPFEQVAFERWLDANPRGTTLLVDTYSVEQGIANAIRAASGTPGRRKALVAVRIDSGDLILQARYCRRELDAHGLPEVGLVLTGDLDLESITRIKAALDFPILGFGVGTRLSAEVDRVAGVIFKLCQVEEQPVMKTSESRDKQTLPGVLQVWRCQDREGGYLADIISLEEEGPPLEADFAVVQPLLEPFRDWLGHHRGRSPQELKSFVQEQSGRFRVPLEDYPVRLSPGLEALRARLLGRINQAEDRPVAEEN